MKLRKQLLFLSLVTLSLPWVGCQYVREMDASLRRGQSEAMAATARAVSARIRSEPALLANLTRLRGLRHPLYVNTLRGAAYLDGYDDEWLSQNTTRQTLPGHPNIDSALGRHGDTLFIFLRVEQRKARYFNPAQPALSGVDHLQLGFGHNRYAVLASGPGAIKAVRLSAAAEVSDKTTEHRIKGHWLEAGQGYQLELALPWDWVSEGMWLQFQQPGLEHSWIPLLEPLVAESGVLNRELDIFTDRNLRLHVFSASAHRLAHAGQLALQAQGPQPHGFLEWLYNLALGKSQWQQLDSPLLEGRWQGEPLSAALQGGIGQTWYALGNQTLARVAVPVQDSDGFVVGAVLAEQSAQSLAQVTNNAFGTLLAYSFLASLIAAVSLVLYATWLSLRIRTLSEATAHAVSDSGKITDHFPVSQRADELGELSRNYAQLLSRLREYTHYLRTLSSKLSHELRTPLAIVRSSLDNLEHERLSRQAKIYADRAREGTTRLSNILNAMSAASRTEQAIGAAEREYIPCDEMLRSLVQAYGDVYTHVTFTLNLRPDPRGFTIHGAGELLVQAFDKLVDNAADFCPAGGKIELGLYREAQHIVFTVRNEGPPLPSHMHGQLFDSMVSVRDKQSTEDGHHLGLGLYIVRLITDFHHGEVSAYNVPDNSGVIFEVRLPAEGEHGRP